jgi:hypothetical protein
VDEISIVFSFTLDTLIPVPDVMIRLSSIKAFTSDNLIAAPATLVSAEIMYSLSGGIVGTLTVISL